MPDSEYSRLRRQYEAEFTADAELAKQVAEELGDELERRGIRANVSHRGKDPDSSATKALMAEMAEPLRDLRDRAGARATVDYLEDVKRVEQAARDLFQVIHVEDKLDALGYDEVGYLGRHVDLRLRGGDGRRAELQIRTSAQSAWAQISHEQLYKPAADVPPALKRRIYRLVSLVELFDNEVAGFLAEARATPGFAESQAITPLARVLLERFDDRRSPDRQLSLTIAGAIVPTYNVAPAMVYGEVLGPWIDANEAKLRQVFQEMVAEGDANPLVHQPEVFLILERLEGARFELQVQWPVETVPREWLNDLAAAWGVRLED